MEPSSDEQLDSETNPLDTPDMNIGAEGFGTRRAQTPPSQSSLVDMPVAEDAKAEEGDDSEPIHESPFFDGSSYEKANEGDDSEPWPIPDKEADQHYNKGSDADDSLEQIVEQNSSGSTGGNEGDDSEAIPAPDKEIDQHYDGG